MSTVELLWQTLAVILTLFVFSFLYKDNPFYKFAERLVAGVATGYWTMLLFWNLFVDKVWAPLESIWNWPSFLNFDLYYIIPILLGMGMWTRFSKNYAWISRYSIAFYIGISSGLAIPLYMYTNIFRQISASIIPLDSVANVLVVICVLSSLFYLFHSSLFGLVYTLYLSL